MGEKNLIPHQFVRSVLSHHHYTLPRDGGTEERGFGREEGKSEEGGRACLFAMASAINCKIICMLCAGKVGEKESLGACVCVTQDSSLGGRSPMERDDEGGRYCPRPEQKLEQQKVWGKGRRN